MGWRDVPTRPEVLGEKARFCMPHICQCFVKRPTGCARGLDFDRKLYVARRVFEQSNVTTYVPSFSSRTVVYKGMFLVGQLREFYPELSDPDFKSAIALVHARFSTNTNPSWERAHPNRFILHNGEINTIRGNVDRILAREVRDFYHYYAAMMEPWDGPAAIVFSDGDTVMEKSRKTMPAVNTMANGWTSIWSTSRTCLSPTDR